MKRSYGDRILGDCLATVFKFFNHILNGGTQLFQSRFVSFPLDVTAWQRGTFSIIPPLLTRLNNHSKIIICHHMFVSYGIICIFCKQFL